MNQLQENIKPYSKSIAKLLKGTVESKDTVWNDIILYKNDIQQYINQIGLELILKEDDGYAYIKQFEIDEEGNTIGLVSRRKVGFETSILLVILRQIIEEFEYNPIDIQSNERYISHEELRDEIELFLPEQYNKVKFIKDLDNYITRTQELGYLKEVKSNDTEKLYKIHRIVKEKVTLDMLKEFKEKLQVYVESI